MGRITFVLLVLGIVCQPVNALTDTAARLALLIGNQGYAKVVGPLKNPHNDVDLIAGALRRIGFRVTVVKDATYRKMDIAIRQHVEKVRRSGENAISFFYYSGHGVANPETKRNFLIPVDATSADDANIWYEAFQQDEIINRLVKDAGNATHYVIFDACRDELRLSGPSAKALGDRKGFVPIADTAGILIAYTTAPGRTASDAGKDSGPYARALASEVVKPGVEAVSMFRNVQLRVKQAIGQDPWLSFPALPAVYLAGKEKRQPKRVQTKPVGPTFTQQAELEYWNAVKASKDPLLLQTYIEQFPLGTFTPLARILVGKLKNSAEKQALAMIKKEELRAAEEKRKQVEVERIRAMRKATFARQADELQKAREEAKKAHQALRLAEREHAKALKAAEEALRVGENAKRELDQAVDPQVTELSKPASADIQATEPSGAKQDQAGFEAIGPIQLAKRVQTELKRLGCLTGPIDGIWGAGSKRAMVSFNRVAKLSVGTEKPSREVLVVLARRRTPVCSSKSKRHESSGSARTGKRQSQSRNAARERAKKKKCVTYSKCMRQCWATAVRSSLCPNLCTRGAVGSPQNLCK